MQYSKKALGILSDLIKTFQTEECEKLKKENKKLKRENKTLKGENKSLKKESNRVMGIENHNRIIDLSNKLEEKLFNDHI